MLVPQPRQSRVVAHLLSEYIVRGGYRLILFYRVAMVTLRARVLFLVDTGSLPSIVTESCQCIGTTSRNTCFTKAVIIAHQRMSWRTKLILRGNTTRCTWRAADFHAVTRDYRCAICHNITVGGRRICPFHDTDPLFPGDDLNLAIIEESGPQIPTVFLGVHPTNSSRSGTCFPEVFAAIGVRT